MSQALSKCRSTTQSMSGIAALLVASVPGLSRDNGWLFSAGPQDSLEEDPTDWVIRWISIDRSQRAGQAMGWLQPWIFTGNMAAWRTLGILCLIAEYKECMQQQWMLLFETWRRRREENTG